MVTYLLQKAREVVNRKASPHLAADLHIRLGLLARLSLIAFQTEMLHPGQWLWEGIQIESARVGFIKLPQRCRGCDSPEAVRYKPGSETGYAMRLESRQIGRAHV